MDLRGEVNEMMARIREGRLPSSEAIVQEAFRELGYHPGMDSRTIRVEFNDRLKEVFEKTLEVLERYEDQAYGGGLVDELLRARSSSVQTAEKILRQSSEPSKGFRDAVHHLLLEWYPMLRQVFLSISQSRKTRGGKDFELQFGALLEYAGIPYQKKRRQTHTDFMIPSDEVFARNRNIALVLSAKRTLRERWREVAEELYSLRAPNVYLVTADTKVTQGHISGICREHNIHLVVWDEIKQEKFRREQLVIGYTELATEVFSLFENRWQ